MYEACAAHFRKLRQRTKLASHEEVSKKVHLQEELRNARQQLHDAEQLSRAALAATLSEREVAWKSAQQESQQRLQQALDEVAVSDAALGIKDQASCSYLEAPGHRLGPHSETSIPDSLCGFNAGTEAADPGPSLSPQARLCVSRQQWSWEQCRSPSY